MALIPKRAFNYMAVNTCHNILIYQNLKNLSKRERNNISDERLKLIDLFINNFSKEKIVDNVLSKLESHEYSRMGPNDFDINGYSTNLSTQILSVAEKLLIYFDTDRRFTRIKDQYENKISAGTYNLADAMCIFYTDEYVNSHTISGEKLGFIKRKLGLYSNSWERVRDLNREENSFRSIMIAFDQILKPPYLYQVIKLIGNEYPLAYSTYDAKAFPTDNK